MGISARKDLADQKRNNVKVLPGYKISIKIMAGVTDASENFVDLTQEQRNYKLSHETKGFKFLRNYSKFGCELECAINKSISICHCLPLHLPNNFTVLPICDSLGAK